MKCFDVLVIGELNVDIILNQIQGFPVIGKEIIAEKMNITLGSSSAIFASNLSSFDTKVAFLGKIGEDNFADIVISSLQQKNVNTDAIIKTQEYKTGLTVVMNYDMDRANVTYPGAMEHLSVHEITDTLLLKAKHLHLSSVFLQTLLLKDIEELFQRAKNLGLTTSMDPQWDPLEKWNLDLEKLLPYIDVFMPNTEEFKHLTQTDTIIEGLKKVKSFANTIIIKDGENGAHLWNGKELISKPALLNDNVVDCIGAGDSFDAGFISEYIKGTNLERCLEIGNVAGALNTTGFGGTSAFENIDQIKKLAIEKFLYPI
ncbi:carbohydrate kinase family protein [Cellulophaga sp. E16_2]|uniref:carbohydrate kinase family protein n=1 Tax=Cellulophaga sp. E16_2 TaxID=2789297 RepID=UPI001A923B9A|nr:carbohydrate kinase family protein [Cellulophaga sp. E16_2]MBO0590178.1 carbohydrate kinase family protein [Cellulophaga sp. E16_2]